MRLTARRMLHAIMRPLSVCDVMLESKTFIKLPDKTFLRLRYYFRLNKHLNLKNPKTFNEKMQYLKLYNRRFILTKMADKYAVKELVTSLIGKEYVVSLLGVWNGFDEIDFDALPKKFVLKTTHDCGGVFVCKDKKEMNKHNVRKKMEEHLTYNYYTHAREWPYKAIPRRIIAEEYIEDPSQECLVVYKVFCFGGKPYLVQVIQGDKTERETIDYFDLEWKLLSIKQNYPNSKVHMEKPNCLSRMLDLSEKLAGDMPFIRVDWYIVGDKLLFSEFTMYSDAGFEKFNPQYWDEKLGQHIDLSLARNEVEETLRN